MAATALEGYEEGAAASFRGAACLPLALHPPPLRHIFLSRRPPTPHHGSKSVGCSIAGFPAVLLHLALTSATRPLIGHAWIRAAQSYIIIRHHRAPGPRPLRPANGELRDGGAAYRPPSRRRYTDFAFLLPFFPSGRLRDDQRQPRRRLGTGILGRQSIIAVRHICQDRDQGHQRAFARCWTGWNARPALPSHGGAAEDSEPERAPARKPSCRARRPERRPTVVPTCWERSRGPVASHVSAQRLCCTLHDVPEWISMPANSSRHRSSGAASAGQRAPARQCAVQALRRVFRIGKAAAATNTSFPQTPVLFSTLPCLRSPIHHALP
ncbi:hypothetical protein BU26DRAFT_591431 [Trematosphaeria pertusa]|uniref:Uncharacterized protein n=1 Tax=Trematosphaeria pertusa TaxID=390896 RepID=A0A6A6IK58_9PLEO|nr:uncharacterized protein BU26DRAFT_591431 [Trematosphaeria pertusa]KAF2250557.1 hypothetical protein BU26DRAFT_591431 [Trematosphaeria pertusa]